MTRIRNSVAINLFHLEIVGYKGNGNIEFAIGTVRLEFQW